MGWTHNRWKGLLQHAVIIFIAGGITVLAYSLAIQSTYHDFSYEKFKSFVFHYTYAGVDNWGTLSHFSKKGFLQLLRGFNYGFYDGRVVGVALYQIMIALWIVILVSIFILQRKSSEKQTHSLALILGTWLVAYVFFVWWWIPGEGEFFTPPVWIMIMLSVIILSGRDKRILPRKIFPVYLVFFFVLMLSINLPAELWSPYKPWKVKEKVLEFYDDFPNDAVIIDDFFSTQVSDYYLGRQKLNVDLFLKQIYEFDTTQCMEMRTHPKVIPVKFLNPEYQSLYYSFTPTPESWKFMLEWLVDFGRKPIEQETYQSLSFEVKHVDGQPSFFVKPPYRQYLNPKDFLSALMVVFKDENSTIYNQLVLVRRI